MSLQLTETAAQEIKLPRLAAVGLRSRREFRLMSQGTYGGDDRVRN